MNKNRKNVEFLGVILILITLVFSLLVSCPNDNSSKVSFKEEKQFEFKKGETISENNTFVLVLNDYTFSENVSVGDVVNSTASDGIKWITSPIDSGVNFVVKEINKKRTEITVAIEGAFTNTFTKTPIKGEIDAEYLLDADSQHPTTSEIINTRYSKITTVPGKAVLSIPKTIIEGEIGQTLDPTEITITGTNVKFKEMKVASVNANQFFSENKDNGLKYALKSDVVAGSSSITIVITSDEIKSADTSELKITIPGNYLSIGINLSVNTNGSTFEFGKNTWRLYDLAAFGPDLKSVSPNKNMTKNADGSDIEFTNALITKGNSTNVRYEKGLSRKGYKLLGFAVKGEDGNVDIKNIKYPATSYDIKSGFTIPEGEKATSLYAVWAQDESSKYFKEAFKFGITKSEIDAANPTGVTGLEKLTDLKHHDGATELESDYKQEFSFIALPGGKIGGTEENPEYFKWPVSWTSNSAPTTVADIKEDFAISDITLTPALFNVVYKWATDSARGTDVYKFNLDTSSPLLAGISYVNNTSTSRHSAEDPLVRMNWYQSVIFANALTEWYNDVHKSDAGFVALTAQYVDESGTTLRDATQTTTLDKINPLQNTNYPSPDAAHSGLTHKGTGFRLPTRAEWQYASSVLSSEVPEGWNTTGSVSYPWAQSYAYTSGVNEVAASTPTDGVKAVAVYDYYSRLLSSEYGTQTVGKYFKKDSVRTEGAKPNKLGVYDMSGNVWEWAEDWYSSSYRYLSGGSWSLSAGNLFVGYAYYNTPSSRSSNSGIRFCMPIPPSK